MQVFRITHPTNKPFSLSIQYFASFGCVHGPDDEIDETGEKEARDEFDEDTVEPKVDSSQHTVIRLGPLAEVDLVQRRIGAS